MKVYELIELGIGLLGGYVMYVACDAVFTLLGR